jgi:hypothetical protein
MKTLLIVTAAIEVSAGLTLSLMPSLAASLLLGFPLGTPTASVIARLAGVALLALGVGCWLGHLDGGGRAAKALVGAMLFYNAGTVALLTYARFVLALFADLLWPAILLHAAMCIWCVTSLRNVNNPRRQGIGDVESI